MDIIDAVIQILTESPDPARYIKDMCRRDPQLAEGWGQIAIPLSLFLRQKSPRPLLA